MKKVVLLLVSAGLLVAFAVPSTFAALTDKQQTERDSIYQEMNDLQKQMQELYNEADKIKGQATDNSGDEVGAKEQEPGMSVEVEVEDQSTAGKRSTSAPVSPRGNQAMTRAKAPSTAGSQNGYGTGPGSGWGGGMMGGSGFGGPGGYGCPGPGNRW
ncbi:MAG: hypothetical protein IBX71_10695 [Candidatus Desulforudis sp.]|nr:hypothetical protein [Desulforudis sp.]